MHSTATFFFLTGNFFIPNSGEKTHETLLQRSIYTVNSQNCIPFDEVNGAGTLRQEFTALNVLSNECDDYDIPNYWLGKSYGTRTKAYFTLNLGCTKRVIGIILKNSHNDHYKDR